jgi:multidrug efflux system outer membrane protein
MSAKTGAAIVPVFFTVIDMHWPKIALPLLWLLGGCSATPPPAHELPAMPAAFREAAPESSDWIATPASAQAHGPWWSVFHDPQLDQLVKQAGQHNTSIELAAASLAQARATLHGTAAARAPQLDVRASAARQGGPLINAAGGDGNLFGASASLAWELDLFGRLARLRDAAAHDADAAGARLEDTRLLVQADVAQAYFGLRALDAEHALLDAIQHEYQVQLELATRRAAAGYGSELDLDLLRGEAAAARADALAVARRRAGLEHALAALTGQVASGFQLSAVEWDAALPAVPAGLPSTLLVRRPDIAAARDGVAAAQAQGDAARRAWFPNLALTAAFGFASPQLAGLTDGSSQAWSLAGLLAQPLFDGGRRQATLAQADARTLAAWAAYRERILVAFRDTEDQLAALRLLAGEDAARREAAAASGRALRLAESRAARGLASQLELAVVRRDALQARRQLLSVKLARFQATVSLIRALGGGWNGTAADPAEKFAMEIIKR